MLGGFAGEKQRFLATDLAARSRAVECEISLYLTSLLGQKQGKQKPRTEPSPQERQQLRPRARPMCDPPVARFARAAPTR